MNIHLQWFAEDRNIVLGGGGPIGDRGHKARTPERPRPPERVAAERERFRASDHSGEVGVNRNRLSPEQLERQDFAVGGPKGGLLGVGDRPGGGKQTTVRAGGEIRSDEAISFESSGVSGIGSAANKRGPQRTSPVRSLGGRMDDEDNPPVVHGG